MPVERLLFLLVVTAPTLVAIAVASWLASRARSRGTAILFCLVVTPAVAALGGMLIGACLGGFVGTSSSHWFRIDPGPGGATFVGLMYAMVYGGVSFWVGCVLAICWGIYRSKHNP